MQKFPVFPLLNREFAAEGGSLETASTAIHSRAKSPLSGAVQIVPKFQEVGIKPLDLRKAPGGGASMANSVGLRAGLQ